MFLFLSLSNTSTDDESGNPSDKLLVEFLQILHILSDMEKHLISHGTYLNHLILQNGLESLEQNYILKCFHDQL